MTSVHPSAGDGYDADAGDAYDRSRPSYHPDVVAAAVAAARVEPGDVVLELAAGTGILTAMLVEAGLHPIASEPVTAMRDRLRTRLPSVVVTGGTAESIDAADASVAAVFVGQGFHWFDHAAALDEIARVLRDDGALLLLWNVRDQRVEWVRAYTELLVPYEGETPRHHTMEWRRAIEGDARFGPFDGLALDNPWPTSVEGVVDRFASTSFIGALDRATRAGVTAEVRALVEPLGPELDYPYVSMLDVVRRRPRS